MDDIPNYNADDPRISQAFQTLEKAEKYIETKSQVKMGLVSINWYFDLNKLSQAIKSASPAPFRPSNHSNATPNNAKVIDLEKSTTASATNSDRNLIRAIELYERDIVQEFKSTKASGATAQLTQYLQLLRSTQNKQLVLENMKKALGKDFGVIEGIIAYVAANKNDNSIDISRQPTLSTTTTTMPRITTQKSANTSGPNGVIRPAIKNRTQDIPRLPSTETPGNSSNNKNYNNNNTVDKIANNSSRTENNNNNLNNNATTNRSIPSLFSVDYVKRLVQGFSPGFVVLPNNQEKNDIIDLTDD